MPKTVATHKSTYLYLSTTRFYQMLPRFQQMMIGSWSALAPWR